jgi:hypothetical protein
MAHAGGNCRFTTDESKEDSMKTYTTPALLPKGGVVALTRNQIGTNGDDLSGQPPFDKMWSAGSTGFAL